MERNVGLVFVGWNLLCFVEMFSLGLFNIFYIWGLNVIFKEKNWIIFYFFENYLFREKFWYMGWKV